MNTKLNIDAAVQDAEQLAKSTAAIVRSGIFDLARYCTLADMPPDSNLSAAISDYLLQGERHGLEPHDLFVPRYVNRQVQELGIALVGGSVLLTYLAHPDAPLDPHPLFDHRYYVRETRVVSPLEDYLQRLRRGVTPPSPHILFDRAFYNSCYPEVAQNKFDAFIHYIRLGWKEGAQPHPLFNSSFWWRYVSALGIEQSAQDPLSLYCADRATWGASTHFFFDPGYYREQLSIAGLAPSARNPPLADMLLRQPEKSGHRLFDPAFYRAQARTYGIDVAEHSLVHFVKGKGKGKLDPHPLFCEAFYLRRYPDVAASGINAFEHFVRAGQAEGRDPNPLFSRTYYGSANSEVPQGEKCALEHYIAHGRALLDPHPLFEARVYAEQHPECLRPGDTPLGHYSRTWSERGLRFPPWGTALFPQRRAAPDGHPPEVIVVSHELSRTGAPAILLRIVQHLVARLALRTLVVAVQGGELLEDFCEWSDTVDLSLTPMAGVTTAGFMASLRASFSERCRPRLVIFNTACVDQEVVTFGGDAPVLTLIHEMASGFSEARFRSIYANADLVIYPAEIVRTEAHVLYPLPIEKTAVIPQGLLDPEFGRGDARQARASLLEEIAAEPEAFIVLGCGTMDMRKGLDAFVHVALSTLRAAGNPPDGRPVHFVWIGGGPTNTHSVVWYARQDIDRSGLAERIHVLGPRPSTEKYFLACDAFIMTSRMDPFPCVIHEAMACAKPIIAFADAGGAPEALRDDAGIVVGYGDVVAMAEEILRLCREPDRAGAYGTRAREVVRTRYVFSDYVDRMISLVQERLGVAIPEPQLGSTSRRVRRRVVVTCGESEPQSNWQLSEFLVGGLLDRGFDAELIFTGNPRALPPPDRVRIAPVRVLSPSFGKSLTHKQRWDALTRILEVASPVVLIHNLDLIGSALAPIPCPGAGILGIVSAASQAQLEQAARLGRYWQRAVATSESVAQRVLDAAPILRERLVVIPRPAHRYPEPERRHPGRPLGIVVSGRHPRQDSAKGFLVPLLRGLHALRVPFTLTAVGAGPEAELLKTAATAEVNDGRVRILDSPTPQEISELLRASDVLVMLANGSDGGIDLLETMSAGLAIITVAKDDEAENLLREGIDGFSAPMASVRTCVECLGQLARDRDLLERMRGAAHQTGHSAPDAAQVCDAYAALIEEMLEELRSRAYAKPAALYVDAVFGALSLPPMFQMNPVTLGFAMKP
ncbi:MAG: glycosyltransferase family 4 protein [Steroidobacterales bacterium]